MKHFLRAVDVILFLLAALAVLCLIIGCGYSEIVKQNADMAHKGAVEIDKMTTDPALKAQTIALVALTGSFVELVGLPELPKPWSVDNANSLANQNKEEKEKSDTLLWIIVSILLTGRVAKLFGAYLPPGTIPKIVKFFGGSIGAVLKPSDLAASDEPKKPSGSV